MLWRFCSAPATAADWGGIKEIGGDIPIPVPAPAPVPTYDIYSDWYVGFAIGANILQDATITDTDTDYLGDSTPGFFARDSDDIGTSPIFGLNFGRYITPSLRAEIAIDYTPMLKSADPELWATRFRTVRLQFLGWRY